MARVRRTAFQQGHNNPAARKAAEAQAAAPGPQNERPARAAAAQVATMEAQEPAEFDREAFKQAVRTRIEQIAPQTLKEMEDFKSSGGMQRVQSAVAGEVEGGRQAAAGPVQAATEATPDASAQPAKDVAPLPPTAPGPAPAPVGAAQAVPPPASAAAVDMSAGPTAIDTQMAEANVSEETLARANEPEFSAALEARAAAATDAATAPQTYRAEEQAARTTAARRQEAAAASGLAEMHGTRGAQFAAIVGDQARTQTADEAARAEVFTALETIHAETQAQVTTRLDAMETAATTRFTAGAQAAVQRAVDYVDDAIFRYKVDRYLSIPGIGAAAWVRDQFLGLPDEVNAFYDQAKRQFFADMDALLDEVGGIVETGLAEAKALIAAGRARVDVYVAALPENLAAVGAEATAAIQSRFDALASSVDERRDRLVDSIARSFVENATALNTRLDEIRAANRGLVDRARELIGGVLATIARLKAMLMGVAASAAAVIERIISDPIGFLGNLIGGIRGGLSRFAGNILTHLRQGFMQWLFGTLASAGIQLPDSFDLRGILGLVLQVFGLTYANFRARAVRIAGEPMVAAIEGAVEIFQVLMREGPAGLWRFLVEQLANLKDMLIEEIQSWLITNVITAGISWIISLFNPASAFVRAVMMIVDVVRFFVDRGAQVVALVQAIVGSLAAIASGSIGALASAVEGALARAIPMAIGFLASLLGLGGIARTIQGFIQRLQAPVNRAIDWLVGQAVRLGRRIGTAVRGALGGDRQAGAPGHENLPGPAASGPTHRPTIDIPFTMSGASHTMSLAPREGGDIEVLMASGTFGKATDQFRAAQQELDNLRRYIRTDLQDQTVRELFELEFGDALDTLPAGLVQRFTTLYRRYFPPGSTGELTEAERTRARQQVGALTSEAQTLVQQITSWAARMGVDGFGRPDFNETIQTRGNQLWSQAWQRTRAGVQEVIGGFDFRGVPVQMRGSVQKGFRGDPKARVRFDERDFDVDLYVEHKEAYDAAVTAGARVAAGKIFPQRAVPDLSALSSRVASALRARFPTIARVGESDVVLRREPPRG